MYHPEKRKQIIGLYKDVIDFFISNKTDRTIVEESVISLMISDIVEFKGKELLPEIQKLYDEDFVDESMAGCLQEVMEQLDEIPEIETAESYKKSIQNYFEIASEFSFAFNDDEEEFDEEEEDGEDLYDDWEEIKEDDTDYFYSGDKPFVRTMPKVGRNEPCPCGSGKKYKNCHGIDE